MDKPRMIMPHMLAWDGEHLPAGLTAIPYAAPQPFGGAMRYDLTEPITVNAGELFVLAVDESGAPVGHAIYEPDGDGYRRKNAAD